MKGLSRYTEPHKATILQQMKAITSPNHLYSGLYDSHAHLFHLQQKGLDILSSLRQWRSDGLEFLMDIVLEPSEEDWLWHTGIVEHCRQQPQLYPQVWLAAGLHPNDADGSSAQRYPTIDTAQADDWDFEKNVLEPRLKIIAKRAASEATLAIGETGLDYYHSQNNKGLQHKSLEFHIRLAQQYRKVLIIHNRDSDKDLQQVLCASENCLSAGGIMHCFSGNPSLIYALLDKGFYFSFAGNLSYKNAPDLRQAAHLVPCERLLIETDAPFLAPGPVRGQINHPGFIGHTLDVLAQCHNMDPEAMLQQLRKNLLQLFPKLSSDFR